MSLFPVTQEKPLSISATISHSLSVACLKKKTELISLHAI